MSSVSSSHPTGIIKGTIQLPASKSISNRALILKAVSKQDIKLNNLSEADDTVIMLQALLQRSGEINIKNAGTCMRFLTAFFAATEGKEVTLTCDPRMELRPVHLLVNALKQLGADISYLKNEGFPPLRIKGKQLKGGTIRIDASMSSQFISALMMIAPVCSSGLTIELTGQVSSQPYIDMTARMMQQFGFDIEVNYPNIYIPHQSNTSLKQIPDSYKIEPDWSAASYWYEIAALSKEAEVLLTGLSTESLQGDRAIADMMIALGIQSSEIEGGIIIRKVSNHTQNKENSVIDLANTPDLTPSLAVTAAATNTELTLTGLQNLAIKESDRLHAISTELKKCGFNISTDPSNIQINPQPPIRNSQFSIQTYGDHRIAMAFAPLALLFSAIEIQYPEVVEKSYPGFWNDLHKTGFDLKN